MIPARFDLENRVSEAAVLGAHTRLARALTGADDDFAVTLIDLPPSLGHLTQLGLAAADLAVCTVEPEYDAVEGALRFRDFIARHGEQLHPGPSSCGWPATSSDGPGPTSAPTPTSWKASPRPSAPIWSGAAPA